MKIFTEPDFLAKGSAQIPNYQGMTGVGIHSSSEVDSCTVSGVRLGVKAIVPCGPGAEIRAERNPWKRITTARGMTEFASPADGNPNSGNKLVLQIYECDEFNIPGPRATYVTRCGLSTAALPTTRVTARAMCAVPMSGRVRCAISWFAFSASTIINVAGVRSIQGIAALQNSDSVPLYGYTISNPNDYASTLAKIAPAGVMSNGTGAPQQTIYIDNESFDYLLIWAWDPNPGYLDLLAEASGERLQ